jgi:hypothetical protein
MAGKELVGRMFSRLRWFMDRLRKIFFPLLGFFLVIWLMVDFCGRRSAGTMARVAAAQTAASGPGLVAGAAPSEALNATAAGSSPYDFQPWAEAGPGDWPVRPAQVAGDILADHPSWRLDAPMRTKQAPLERSRKPSGGLRWDPGVDFC